MSAFDQGWAIAKEFRFNDRGYDILEGGGYDPSTDEAFANLSSHTQGFKMKDPERGDFIGGPQVFRNDEQLVERILRILGHEQAHQGLNPPYSDDIWNEVSMRGLPDDISDEERAQHQRKVDTDWMRMQEYGAWSATPGVDEAEKWKMLSMYGIYPRGGDE